MTTTTTGLTASAEALGTPSTVTLRPGYEGGNISTTIGFKHVHYLIEAAVLEHFRAQDLGPTRLYLEFGVDYDTVAVDTRLHTVLTLDDAVEFSVTPLGDGARDVEGAGARFAVTGTVRRDGAPKKAVTSKVRVALVTDPNVAEPKPLPSALERFRVPSLATAEPADLAAAEADNIDLSLGRIATSAADPVLREIIGDANAFGWKWAVPYWYAHFTRHVNMTGYLRQMEEALSLFVASRGIGIRRLLDERGWIPVVTQCRLEITGEVGIDDNLYTVFTVESIFKDILFTARMDCYTVVDGRLVHAATGTITHGYVSKESPDKDWQLSVFDDEVLRALRGERG